MSDVSILNDEAFIKTSPNMGDQWAKQLHRRCTPRMSLEFFVWNPIELALAKELWTPLRTTI